MKKVVCELCEGTEFTKIDGMFVCSGCGTKYSAEEARSMMKEVEGEAPIQTGAPVVGAPVVGEPAGNPNQAQIDNMLILAANAHEAGNNQEAENFCNQVIALDAMSYKAWFLKGQAIGWSSTLGNNRMEEAAHSFCKAIDFAPEDEKDDLKDQAVEELKRLGLACIDLRKKNFANDPGNAELIGFKTDRKVLIDSLTVLLSHGNAVGMPEGYLDEIAKLMTDSARTAFLKVQTVWKNADHPGDGDFKTYLDWLGNIQSLLVYAIDASDDDDEADIPRYNLLIEVVEEPLQACSWEKQWSSYQSRYVDVKSLSLNEKAKQSRIELANGYKQKIKRLRESVNEKKIAEQKKAEEEKKARIDAYWEAHAEEKEKLEAEKKQLSEKKDELQAKIDKVNKEIRTYQDLKKEEVPSEMEKKKYEDQIRDLRNRRANLGAFSGKEKKQIDADISALEGAIASLKSKIEDERVAKNLEYDKKLAPFNEEKSKLGAEIGPIIKRIEAIDTELNKDPEE